MASLDQEVVLRMRALGVSETSKDFARLYQSIVRLEQGMKNVSQAGARQAAAMKAQMKEQEAAVRSASVAFRAARVSGEGYAQSLAGIGKSASLVAASFMPAITAVNGSVKAFVRLSDVGFKSAESMTKAAFGADAITQHLLGTRMAAQSAAASFREAEASAGALSYKWLIAGILLNRAGDKILSTLHDMIAANEEYSKALVFAQNTIGATTEQTLAMKKAVASLPPVLGTTTELMQGMGQTLTAGFRDPADALKVLSAAASAAKGSATELKVSVDAVTSVMQAYAMSGEQASHVTDVLLKAVDLGKVTFNDYASNIGNVVTIAADAGVSLEELTAAVAVLTKRGMPAAQVMTTLRNVFIRMLKPMGTQKKLFTELGIHIDKAKVEAEGFTKVFSDILEKGRAKGYSAMDLFPQMRALKGAVALASESGLQDLAKNLEMLDASAGKTARNLDRHTKSMAGALDTMRNAMESLKQEMGDSSSGPIAGAARAVSDIIQLFRGMPDSMKGLIESTAMMSAGFLGVTASIAGAKLGINWMLSVLTGSTGLAGMSKLAGEGISGMSRSIVGWGLAIAGAVVVGNTFATLLDTLNKLTREYKDSQEEALGAQVRFAQALKTPSGAAALAVMKELNLSYAEFYDQGKTAYEMLAANAGNADMMTEADLKLARAYRDLVPVMDKYKEAAEKAAKADKDSEASKKKTTSTIAARVKVLEDEAKKTLAEATALGKSIKQHKEYDRIIKSLGPDLTLWLEKTGKMGKIFKDGAVNLSALSKATDEYDTEAGIAAGTQELLNQRIKDGSDAFDVFSEYMQDASYNLGVDFVESLGGGMSALLDFEDAIKKTGANVKGAFADTMSAALTGDYDQISKIWTDLWKDLMDEVSKMFSSWIVDLFKGDMKIGDIEARFSEMSNLGKTITAAGGIMGVYNAYQQGGTMGAISGALSGGMAGFAIGSMPFLSIPTFGASAVIGAAIGALAGIAASVFGGQDKPPTPSIGWQWQPGGATVTGTNLPSGAALTKFQKSLNSTALASWTAWLDIMESLGKYSKFSEVTTSGFTIGGLGLDENQIGSIYTKDFQSVMEEVLSSMPEWIRQKGFGVAISNSMMRALMDGVEAAPGTEAYDKAYKKMAALVGDVLGQGAKLGADEGLKYIQRFVTGLISITNAINDTNWDKITDVVSNNSMQTLMSGLTDTLDQIALIRDRMGAEIDMAAKADDVTRIAELAKQARQAEIQMLQQINQLQKNINSSIDAQIEGIKTGGMSPQQKIRYYTNKYQSLMAELAAASSPEDVQRIMQGIQDTISNLTSAYGPGLYGREGFASQNNPAQKMIDDLNAARDLANKQIEAMRQAVKDKNDALLDALNDTKDDFTDLGTTTTDLATAVADTSQSVSALSSSAQEAGQALSNLATAARALAGDATSPTAHAGVYRASPGDVDAEAAFSWLAVLIAEIVDSRTHRTLAIG